MKLRVFTTLIIACSLILASSFQAHALEPVNSAVMLRGYFYAGSDSAYPGDFGGFALSTNTPRPGINMVGSPDKVSLIARTNRSRTFNNNHQGFEVVLLNRTKATLVLSAQDSRLSIVHEALNSSGAWQAIEYLPTSWCGNSYHHLSLPPNHYWSFTAPVYTGSIKTKLRLRLTIDGKNDLFSDEFDGAVNPEQFSTKQGHTAVNLMDPYNE